jgi:hypothetical protein
LADRSNGQLQFDAVIRHMNEILLRTEIPLDRLDGCVAQEQLDFVQARRRQPDTFSRNYASDRGGGDSGDFRGGGVRLEQLPDDLFAETGALRVAAAPASASVGVTTGGNWRGAIRV